MEKADNRALVPWAMEGDQKRCGNSQTLMSQTHRGENISVHAGDDRFAPVKRCILSSIFCRLISYIILHIYILFFIVSLDMIFYFLVYLI